MSEEEAVKKRWYVVQAYSQYESRVKKTLLEYIKMHNMEDYFGQVLVPTEEVVEMRAGHFWIYLKELHRPMPITQKEADAILNRLEENVDKPRPKTLFEPGEVIRVIDGPFADFNGVVEEVDYEKSRVKVSVLIFGRSTPVDLEFGQVEKG